jgi:hypothetical protein
MWRDGSAPRMPPSNACIFIERVAGSDVITSPSQIADTCHTACHATRCWCQRGCWHRREAGAAASSTARSAWQQQPQQPQRQRQRSSRRIGVGAAGRTHAEPAALPPGNRSVRSRHRRRFTQSINATGVLARSVGSGAQRAQHGGRRGPGAGGAPPAEGAVGGQGPVPQHGAPVVPLCAALPAVQVRGVCLSGWVLVGGWVCVGGWLCVCVCVCVFVWVGACSPSRGMRLPRCFLCSLNSLAHSTPTRPL